METRKNTDNLQFLVEPVLLPNQVPDQPARITSTTNYDLDAAHYLMPSKPTLTEKRPASPDEILDPEQQKVKVDRVNLRLSSKGLYGGESLVKTHPADRQVLEAQKDWEEAQAQDVSGRSSFRDRAADSKPSVPGLRDLGLLNTGTSESKENTVPLLDRARSIKKSRSQRVEDYPEFADPVQSSHALIMQSIPAKTEPNSAQSLSPMISPVSNLTSLSGPASSTRLLTPLDSPVLSKPALSRVSYTGVPVSKQQPPVQSDQKPANQTTNTSPCCVIL